MEGLLEGKVGIVFGGATGLGWGTCQKARAWGGTPVPISRRREKVAEAVEQLGQGAPVLAADSTDPQAVRQAVQAVVDRYGRLDFLCYFPGELVIAPPERLTPAAWSHAMEVNTAGALWASQAAFPTMKAAGRGVIVLTTSLSAHAALGGVTLYSVCKHALLGLAANLANEWGQHGIRVIPLSPGVIETDLNREALRRNPTRTHDYLYRTPLGRFGRPEEIGAMAAFLCSDEAGFCTGSPVVVDGGFLVNGAHHATLPSPEG